MHALHRQQSLLKALLKAGMLASSAQSGEHSMQVCEQGADPAEQKKLNTGLRMPASTFTCRTAPAA